MKEIKNIIETYHKIDFSRQKAALATVVRVEGSSYRRTGARMLITDSGEWIGGISGGCLEGDALKRAKLAMAQGKSTIVTYDTTDDDPYQIGVGLGCNGIIDVLLTPLDFKNENNAVLTLKNCINSRTPNVVICVTHLKGKFDNFALGQTFRFEGKKHFSEKFSKAEIANDLINEIENCLLSETSTSKNYQSEEGEIKFFIEVIIPSTHLLIYGGNYDIYPMVKLAKEIGWKVSVICNPLKVHKNLFEMADEVIDKEKSQHISVDPYTVALLMAHDYETDFRNMRNLLKTNIRYIGMLGPKKRTDKMFTKLSEEGTPVGQQDLARIATPVGLDIGAITPEEIAISIIAEIKTFFSGRDGSRLTFRKGAIYG
ncbi:XdhC/CoxI family protein [Arcicella aurantiaca]|uniref:XdhC/CoxI family protein n=1 Tax=Arcicella aurantiaca TaxID=591202 RepID=A0A316DP28_9BACT|nr:XdhC family protein [Arcicella aurantiaca]PWK18909.1 XdhC/CoxI family protein [Arcicella aurantiaca]